MHAPKLIAKGVDFLAMRMRQLARRHNIPIIENRALAQTLYATVEIDEEIPPIHYRAVAEIISFIMRASSKTPYA